VGFTAVFRARIGNCMTFEGRRRVRSPVELQQLDGGAVKAKRVRAAAAT